MSDGMIGTAYNKLGAALTYLKGQLLDAMEEQQRAAEENARNTAEAQSAMAQGSAASQISAGNKEAEMLEADALKETVEAGAAIGSAVVSTVALARTTSKSNELMTQSRASVENDKLLKSPRNGGGFVLGAGDLVPANVDRPAVTGNAVNKIRNGQKLELADIAGLHTADIEHLQSVSVQKQKDIRQEFHELDRNHNWQEQMGRASQTIANSAAGAAINKDKAELKRKAAELGAAAELLRGATSPAAEATAKAIDNIKHKQDQIGQVIASLTEATKIGSEYRG